MATPETPSNSESVHLDSDSLKISPTILAPTPSSSSAASSLTPQPFPTPLPTMTPTPQPEGKGSTLVVVDEKGDICASAEDLTQAALSVCTASASSSSSKAGNVELSTDYHLVGILGTQSTGKSTLLNHLFGTSFKMMNASEGRERTTRGIWVESGRSGGKILSMDLEGTDTADALNPDDRGSYERRTALFALALADVLIINLPEGDIGKNAAANLPIMKTIVKVHLDLFANKEKSSSTSTNGVPSVPRTILLYCIRDYPDAEDVEDVTPPEKHEQRIRADLLKNVWSEVQKDADFASAKFEDYFDLRFVFMPSFRYKKKKFVEKVSELRDWFLNDAHANFLFKNHVSKAVPCREFGKYCHNIYSAIINEKRVNLPSQREMLARYRCDEVIAELSKKFASEDISGFESKLKAIEEKDAQTKLPLSAFSVPAVFHDDTKKVVEAAVRDYDDQTKNYELIIVNEKKAEFLRRLVEFLLPIYSNRMNFLIEILRTNAQNDFSSKLPKSSAEISKDFSRIANEVKKDVQQQFDSLKKKMTVSEFESINQWKNADESLKQILEDKLALIIQSERSKQILRFPNVISKFIKNSLTEKYSPLLQSNKSESKELFWKELREINLKLIQVSQSKINDLKEQFKLNEDERTQIENDVKRMIGEEIRHKMSESAKNIETIVRERFHKIFDNDEHGIRRRWKPVDPVRDLFVKARDRALNLIELLSEFDEEALTQSTPSETDDEKSNNILIDADLKHQIHSRISRELETHLLEAEDEQARATPNNWLSWLGVLAILYLLLDPIFFILRNPIYLATIVMATFGVLYVVLTNAMLRGYFIAFLFKLSNTFIGAPLLQLIGGQNLPKPMVQAQTAGRPSGKIDKVD